MLTILPTIVPSHFKLLKRDMIASLFNNACDIVCVDLRRFGRPTAISSFRAITVAYKLAQQLWIACTVSQDMISHECGLKQSVLK